MGQSYALTAHLDRLYPCCHNWALWHPALEFPSSHFLLPFSASWAHPCLSPLGFLSHVIPGLQWPASSQCLDSHPPLHGPVLTGLGGHGWFPFSPVFFLSCAVPLDWNACVFSLSSYKRYCIWEVFSGPPGGPSYFYIMSFFPCSSASLCPSPSLAQPRIVEAGPHSHPCLFLFLGHLLILSIF